MILAAIALVAAQAPITDLAQEMKKLEGKWKVVKVEVGGKASPPEKFQDTFVVIKGNKFVMAKRGKEALGLDATFTIDPNKKPKTMDLTATSQKEGIPVLAIYALDVDELKVCMPLANPLGIRPNTFDTEDKEKPIMTFTCKRDK
jgi:uncharacterized protein (TIGR03067 family)